MGYVMPFSQGDFIAALLTGKASEYLTFVGRALVSALDD